MNKAAILLVASSLLGANANKPHPHQGILKPYTQLPPLVLTDADKAQLSVDKPILRQSEAGSGGRGLAIFHVKAPPQVVWDTINDFEHYPKWIDNLDSTEVYKRDGETIDVAFKISGLGFSAKYFCHHTYHHAEHWGTWTLDYSRESDLDDSVGFWRVTPWNNNPNESLVEYSVDVQVRGWMPGFIRSIFVDRGLKEATQWLKVQSEARAKKK